jgi:hypothetical protein
MIYIDLENNPPPNEWITKATELTQRLIAEPDLQEKKKLIDSNSTIWGEIKEHLLSLSHQKCWYSEAKEKFSYYHVEHFRPKKRALDNNGLDMGGIGGWHFVGKITGFVVQLVILKKATVFP